MENFKPSSEHDLYNEDLAPVNNNDKNVKPSGYGFVWFGLAVQITAFLSLSPMVNYFTIGQLNLIFIIGSILIGLFCFITQDIGLRYGISFATSVSVTFGYKGGKIINMIRTFPSLIFFGLNAYIGAIALNEIFKMVFGFESILLGLILNIAVLVAITVKKLKSIERFIAFAAPLLLLIGIYMLYVVLSAYDVSYFDTLSMGNLHKSDHSVGMWLYSFAVVIGVFSSVALGINDFTKDCKINQNNNKWFQTNKSYFIATFIGLVPPLAFFSILGSITMALSGRTDVLIVISELVQERSVVLAVLLQLFIVVAQASTNAAATLLPSAYAISGLLPRKISFKAAVIGFALLVFIVRPWAIQEHLAFIISLFSFTAGPAIAIIAVDYYIFRKRKISLSDVYNSKGKYRYFKGINPVALVVYVLATVIGFVFFSDLSFYIATTLAAVFYYIAAKLLSTKYPVLVQEETEYTRRIQSKKETVS
ncbi:hypothetical protein F9802_06090 [Bacillus aerolatus]|uniref:Cytosine permease n=1 Tax=Bacillus aerolatus TaxID=2653354 RepID=A0A6I1FIL0_9BACI|nr:cytosine permease [Bacillus aerolatus]KAB7708267.1 hypothetical protein F9802_06090 [Bacillus aerolatus]